MRERLLELYRKRPFQPFTIRVTDGNEYHVKQPECMSFSKHFVVYTEPGTEKLEIIDLLHIAGFQVVPLETEASQP